MRLIRNHYYGMPDDPGTPARGRDHGGDAPRSADRVPGYRSERPLDPLRFHGQSMIDKSRSSGSGDSGHGRYGLPDIMASCTQEILKLRSTPIPEDTGRGPPGQALARVCHFSRTGEKRWRCTACQYPGTWDSRRFRSGDWRGERFIPFLLSQKIKEQPNI